MQSFINLQEAGDLGRLSGCSFARLERCFSSRSPARLVCRQHFVDRPRPRAMVLAIDSADGPYPRGVRQGFNLIPVSGVGEAAGGVNEAVGDEKKRRKRGRTNIQQRHNL